MKQRKPIFQPNELSDATVINMQGRVIVGLIAIACVIPFVIFGDWPFFILISLIMIAATIEIIRCAKTKYSRVLYVTSFVLALLVLFWNVINDIPRMDGTWRLCMSYDDIYLSSTIILVGFTCLSFVVLIDKNFTILDATFIFSTVLIVALGLICILYLRYLPINLRYNELMNNGQPLPNYFNWYDNCESFLFVFYVVLGACLNDAFAYFTGVLFGRHKMNERISPKKTWEGFFGGIFFSCLLTSGLAFLCAAVGNGEHALIKGFLDFDHWYHIVILSTIIPLVSTLGDLYFSSIKRHYKIKDFGNLLPNHGGILDRLDSIIFAMMFAAIYTHIFIGGTGGILLP